MYTLRPALSGEIAAASELCLRSKAYWGYDETFMAACRVELSLAEADLARDSVIVATKASDLAGVAQVAMEEDDCVLEKLFVDPAHMGQGVGGALFRRCLACARDSGARRLVVDSDPNAADFYRAMGCRDAGTAESASIPGRRLPRLVIDTTPAAV